MQNQSSILIDCPIDDVFRLTIEHLPEWSIIVVEDELIEDKGGVGTTFRSVTDDRGSRMEFAGTVVEHNPPYRNAIELIGKSFNLYVVYDFEEVSGKTRVTQSSRAQGKGFFKIFMFLCGWMANKSSCDATNKELESLKAFCEQHAGASVGESSE